MTHPSNRSGRRWRRHRGAWGRETHCPEAGGTRRGRRFLWNAAADRARSLGRTITELYRSWCRHRGGALAAELLLFALLSALPILLSLSALLGSLGSLIGPDAAGRLETSVRNQVTAVLGETTPVLDLVHELFDAPSGRALTVGLLIAVYGAGRGFVSLVGSLDVIFSTRSARGWVAQRVVGLALSTATLLILPLSLALSYASRALASHVADGPLARAAVNHLFNAAAAVLVIVWLTSIYHLAPKDRVRWRDHVPGAAVCVVVAVLVTRVFRLVLPLLGTNLVFGAIGAVISLLWWGYLVCCGFFVGAEVTRHRTLCRSSDAAADRGSRDQGGEASTGSGGTGSSPGRGSKQAR